MKLDCIIVDDEPLSGNFLKRFCEKSARAEVKGYFSNAPDAMVFLQTNVIQVIFLDVEMPGLNGFQMLDKLSYMPKVIMTTSNTDYAFTAFEYKVADFLKKPIDYKRFIAALDKVESLIKYEEANNSKPSLVLKINGTLLRLYHDDILYIESMGDYVKYVTTEGTHITHSTMRTTEEALADNEFIKVHRSYIVNVKKIAAIAENSITIQGASIPVSKTNKAALLKKFQDNDNDKK
jgi:DNA-binding LytR/AlgR family response regulator